MSQARVLTGITTTGTPHLGNYVGAIRPAIEASRQGDTESYYFLADYHALIKCQDPEQVHQVHVVVLGVLFGPWGTEGLLVTIMKGLTCVFRQICASRFQGNSRYTL